MEDAIDLDEDLKAEDKPLEKGEIMEDQPLEVTPLNSRQP